MTSDKRRAQESEREPFAIPQISYRTNEGLVMRTTSEFGGTRWAHE